MEMTDVKKNPFLLQMRRDASNRLLERANRLMDKHPDKKTAAQVALWLCNRAEKILKND